VGFVSGKSRNNEEDFQPLRVRLPITVGALGDSSFGKSAVQDEELPPSPAYTNARMIIDLGTRREKEPAATKAARENK